MHHTAITGAFALLMLGACGPETGPGDPDAGTEGSLTLGTGEGAFRTFEDGETLDLVMGCQGLQHVWVALRAEGIDRRGPIIELALLRAEDGVGVSQAFRVLITFQPVEGEVYSELFGLTMVVPDPAEAIGQDLVLRARVTDMNDLSVTDERNVRIDWGGVGCGEPAPG